MNLNEMSFDELRTAYNDLLAKSYEYMKAICCRRDGMMEAVRNYKEAMGRLGFSEEQMKACLEGDAAVFSITGNKEIPAIPATLDDPNNNAVEIPALPQPTWEKVDVTLVEEEDSINPENQEGKESKEVVFTPAPEEPSVEETDEELVSLEELLSDDPEYRAYYAPEHPVKKSSRTLPTLDELLSDEPINMILCMGNLEPKGAAFRQHSRICHADGIIPTETATGQTIIYIPPAPSVAA